MDFNKIEADINAQKSKFEEIRNTKDAAKFDDICINLNGIFSNIIPFIAYASSTTKSQIKSVLLNMRGFLVDLKEYKNSFGEVEQEVVVDEAVPDKPVEEAVVSPAPDYNPEPVQQYNPEPIQEDPLDISVDEGPSEQSQSESQSMSMGNVKTLTLSNPNMPKHSNPFVQQTAA